ncbi:hypothetical protein EVJ58_g605 [Rhodofomes roseus]|uniref:Glucose-methanol-choline oxidoreductase N-terminal domain-containing protein n=1 Tax=Rhodofomes roseus TaxID=34475 RepID=A0A4Y9Z5D8_9APHY|nr:hypothetical protein EVJ58_g605 [Rhodofomes roseus]
MESKLAAVQDIAGKRFDFVIIGGGTAGLCLANRLSEDAHVSVAVLEAGKAHLDDPKILKPMGWLQQAWQPDYDWAFPLAPQSTCDTSKFSWNRGKGLGGSSSMNLLLWTRPQREDIDALEKLGNPGWNWETFYRYMKKSESFIAPKGSSQNDYPDLYRADALGRDGPVHVSFAQTTSGLEVPVQQAFSERSESILEAMKLRIAEKADQFPPGLKEQYEILHKNLGKPDFPAIEIVVFPFNAVSPVEIDGESKPNAGTSVPSFPVLLPSIQHPLSRGTVHISSADPKQAPSIDPRYFEEEADLDVLVDIFKFTRKMSQMAPFQAVVGAELAPGPKVQTDEDIRAYIKKYIYTTWHSCGTCSMLPQDKGGVVDSKLKVYGTSNVRVVDMSIVPLIPSIHTRPVAYGVAEMAADIIKAAYA